MDLEGNRLSELSQRKTNITVVHSYVESKKPKQENRQSKTKTNSQMQRTDKHLPEGKGFGGAGRRGQGSSGWCWTVTRLGSAYRCQIVTLYTAKLQN